MECDVTSYDPIYQFSKEKLEERIEEGLSQQRYRYHELPNRLPVDDDYYDIGLSSHFLLLYTQLGFDFHVKAINKMLVIRK